MIQHYFLGRKVYLAASIQKLVILPVAKPAAAVKICLSLLLLFSLSQVSVLAQKKNQSFRLHIRPASSPIKIDGIVDEQAWKDADLAADFYMVLPMDTSHAEVKTDVKMVYDKENLYLLAICYNGIPGPYMVES